MARSNKSCDGNKGGLGGRLRCWDLIIPDAVLAFKAWMVPGKPSRPLPSVLPREGPQEPSPGGMR